MLGTLIKIGTGALNAVYGIMKLAPVKNRIVFLSRQSNKPSYDIKALEAWFQERERWNEQERQREAERLTDKRLVEKSNKDEVFRYHIQKIMEEDTSIQETPVLTNDDLVLGIRPEAVDIEENGALSSIVYGAMPTGMETTLKLSVADTWLLTGVIFGSNTFRIGEKVSINLNGNHILLFDRQSGRRISEGRLEFVRDIDL